MLNRVIYLVTAQDHPDVVSRTVMLLHRLAVPIGSLRVHRAGESSILRLTIEAEVIAGQADRIAENLIAAAEQWAGSPEQADDITVVVARMG